MKKLFPGILLILIVVSGQIFAQDFNDYHVLQSQGKVPESFLKSSKQKSYEEIGKTIYSNRSQPYKRKKKEFLLGNNFLIDELLLSGKVLFNDPVGEYVNKVVDTLLKEDPELRKQIEVFVVKSSVVNAFTTSRGTIFINLGLIAKLKNEAQLAFVLSHEIIHFRNKHVMTEFEQSETMRREKGAYRNTTVTEQALAKSMFSRELETEADIQGLKIYLKSKYKVSELKGVFDALQYAHLPYGNVRFDKSFLEANNPRREMR